MTEPTMFACDCGKVLTVPASASGKKVRCPACRRILAVPASPAAEPAPAPSGSPGSGAKKTLPALLVALLAIAGLALKISLKSCGDDGTELRLADGRTLLEVDNSTADDWEVSIDGTAAGTVPAMGVGRYQPSPGTRSLKVTARGREVDSIETTLKKGFTVVFNPRGRTTYQRITSAYHTGSSPTPKGPPAATERIRGQKLVTVHFGLQALPGTTVQVEGRLPKGDTAFTVDTVRRLPPERFTGPEAIAFLRAEPGLYYMMGWEEGAAAAAKSLLETPDLPGAMDAICDSVEKGLLPPQELFKRAWETRLNLPLPRIAKWYNEGTRGTPVAGSGAWILVQGKAELLRDGGEGATLPAAPLDYVRAVLMEMLRLAPSKVSHTAVHRLTSDGTLMNDALKARLLELHEAPNTPPDLRTRIGLCLRVRKDEESGKALAAAAPGARADVLVKRILDWELGRPNDQDVDQLIQEGGIGKLLPELGKVRTGDRIRIALRILQKAASAQRPLNPDEVSIFKRVLDDDETRDRILQQLAAGYRKEDDGLRTLLEYGLEREKDPKKRQRIQALWDLRRNRGS